MTSVQLALCDPTWLDPEPDDEDDGPWCYQPDLWGQGASDHRLATMSTINPIGGYL